MNSAIHPLAPCNNAQLQSVVQVIVKAVHPEHIFLLGACYTRQQLYNIFSDAVTACQQVTHYDLLVLLDKDHRNPDEVQDIIENRCRAHTPVTVIVFDIIRFNGLLESGHAFCCDARTSALQVYDAGRTKLAQPNPCNPASLQLQARNAFSKWHNVAQEFLAGAELYLMRKQFALAAFMLHQAAERSYVELVQVMTGYRAGTHNLDKLSRYAKSFSANVSLVFPRNNEKEERLFRQLQKAYIHSRYKDDYVVTAQEVQELMDRVKKLLELAGEICERKIAGMGEKQTVDAELMCIGKAV
ncbi:MAG TPA: HEPN domain-containing protein [Chitinophagaceae bacterium]|nr:HEPN domain-containing protein [Chitinophagaceae bacterium]